MSPYYSLHIDIALNGNDIDSRISNLCTVIFSCPWPTIGKTAYKLLEIYGILKEAESTMIKYVRL